MKNYVLFVVCVCILAVFAFSACNRNTSVLPDSSDAESVSELSENSKTLVPTPGPEL